MKWPGGAFWIAVAFAAGVGNYAVKQMVQGLDDDLTNVRKKIVAEQKQIHDLTAEWTYLNQPELLADLNRRYLGLVPIAPKQERGGIDEIAMRAAPPIPPGVPEMPGVVTVSMPTPPTKLAATAVPASTSAPAAPAPPQTADKTKPISLDTLFEQAAGSR
ncbi:MAG TPA: hypothetical protein VN808_04160 [Stellaceae bacterium]|nr:hypothetical protein [Stellaceae bacterium]